MKKDKNLEISGIVKDTTIIDGVRHIKEIDLIEISIVNKSKNIYCNITELKDFKDKHGNSN